MPSSNEHNVIKKEDLFLNIIVNQFMSLMCALTDINKTGAGKARCQTEEAMEVIVSGT